MLRVAVVYKATPHTTAHAFYGLRAENRDFLSGSSERQQNPANTWKTTCCTVDRHASFPSTLSSMGPSAEATIR